MAVNLSASEYPAARAPGAHGTGLRAVCVAAALLCACGPVGPIPGGQLSGELVTDPVSDWSFSDEFKNIRLETSLDDPYSVTLWCATNEGQLYIAAARGKESTWARNLVDDPRARVLIDGKLYERKAVHVTDSSEADAALRMFVAKYDFDMPSEEERERGMLFRMDAP
jgi:hypothetical protein